MAHTGFSWDVGNREWTLQSLGRDSGCPGVRWGQGKELLGKGSRNAGPCLGPEVGCPYPTQASSKHLCPAVRFRPERLCSGRSSWRKWRHRPPGFFTDNLEVTGGPSLELFYRTSSGRRAQTHRTRFWVFPFPTWGNPNLIFYLRWKWLHCAVPS